MTIQRQGNEIVIRLISESIDPERLQRLIDYLSYAEITSKSKVPQEEVNKLAKAINKSWWEKNKDQLLKQ